MDNQISTMQINEELHRRLIIQARNLLFEYKFATENRGYVPVHVVQKLMILYGNLIAQEIYKDQEKAMKEKSCKKSAQTATIKENQQLEDHS